MANMSLIHNFFLHIALLPILFYQRCISPLKRPTCRFYPSCSHYASESILVHGLVYGGYLILVRLLRCQPLCRGGYDPVPTKKPPAKTKR